LDFQNIKVSFANNRCNTTILELFLNPTEKPSKRP